MKLAFSFDMFNDIRLPSRWDPRFRCRDAHESASTLDLPVIFPNLENSGAAKTCALFFCRSVQCQCFIKDP